MKESSTRRAVLKTGAAALTLFAGCNSIIREAVNPIRVNPTQVQHISVTHEEKGSSSASSEIRSPFHPVDHEAGGLANEKTAKLVAIDAAVSAAVDIDEPYRNSGTRGAIEFRGQIGRNLETASDLLISPTDNTRSGEIGLTTGQSDASSIVRSKPTKNLITGWDFTFSGAYRETPAGTLQDRWRWTPPSNDFELIFGRNDKLALFTRVIKHGEPAPVEAIVNMSLYYEI